MSSIQSHCKKLMLDHKAAIHRQMSSKFQVIDVSQAPTFSPLDVRYHRSLMSFSLHHSKRWCVTARRDKEVIMRFAALLDAPPSSSQTLIAYLTPDLGGPETSGCSRDWSGPTIAFRGFWKELQSRDSWIIIFINVITMFLELAMSSVCREQTKQLCCQICN